jgi:hypothetical protein
MKSTYCEYILEKILSTSEVGQILALTVPSSYIYGSLLESPKSLWFKADGC